jgi:hypothetical protein
MFDVCDLRLDQRDTYALQSRRGRGEEEMCAEEWWGQLWIWTNPPLPCSDSEPQWSPHYPQGADMRPTVTEPTDDVTARTSEPEGTDASATERGTAS